MSTWQTKRFDEVADIGNGQVNPKKEPYCNFMHIGPENVESGTGRILNPEIAKDLGLISGKHKFDEKSIVYSKIRPNLNKLCTPNFSGLCSADMYPIWPKKFISKSYLYYFMQSPMFVNEAVKCSMRTGLPKINRQDLNHIKINFPTSLDVQKEIVDTLEKWDTTIEKTEALIDSKERQFGYLRTNIIKNTNNTAYKKFSDFLKESRIPDTVNNSEKRLTVRLHLNGVDVRKYRGTEKEGATQYFMRKAGQLIYGKQNIFRGSIGIIPHKLDGYSSSQDIPAFDINKGVNADWLYLVYVSSSLL